MTARHTSLDLSEQRVVITGGSGALGQAIVTTLADHGARICSLDLAAAPGLDRPGVTQVATDITDPDELATAFEHATADLGGTPTTVLCHAGVVGTHALLDYPLDEYDDLMRINVRGSFLPAQHIARVWRDSGIKGHLIFTTSWVHQVPWPEIGPYTASKAAVVQLTRAFARELASAGIRANAVAPGIVGAGMAKHQWDTDDDYRARASRAIPLGSLQTPQSVADAFLFLVSDLASYMTGSVITADGGAGLYPMD